MSAPTSPFPSTDHSGGHETLHFEECLCTITTTDTNPSPLPLQSRIPDPTDPSLPGPCIYHHRLTTRDAETAIFIQLAPEIDELKEVLSSGMVRFQRSQGSQMVLKKATSAELGEASEGLKALISDRERLVRELWGKFVGRWGGRVERRDDGTMFVVGEGRHVLDMEELEKEKEKEEGDGGEEGLEEAGEGKGKKKKKKLEEQVVEEDDDKDPYVKRMREVQARMDDLEVAEERKKTKWAKAGKAADEYAKEDS